MQNAIAQPDCALPDVISRPALMLIADELLGACTVEEHRPGIMELAVTAARLVTVFVQDQEDFLRILVDRLQVPGQSRVVCRTTRPGIQVWRI